MRISCRSSDVCSSDLGPRPLLAAVVAEPGVAGLEAAVADEIAFIVGELNDPHAEQVEKVEQPHLGFERHRVLETEDDAEPLACPRASQEIGSASCRDRVCESGSMSEVMVSLKKKKQKTNKTIS